MATKTMLLRDVPETLHRKFKLHCVSEGISMQKMLLRMMERESAATVVERHDTASAREEPLRGGTETK